VPPRLEVTTESALAEGVARQTVLLPCFASILSPEIRNRGRKTLDRLLPLGLPNRGVSGLERRLTWGPGTGRFVADFGLSLADYRRGSNR